MQPIAAPISTSTVTSSIGSGSTQPTTIGAPVNPSEDMVAEAIIALEPEQVDRMERAAAQQAAVIFTVSSAAGGVW